MATNFTQDDAQKISDEDARWADARRRLDELVAKMVAIEEQSTSMARGDHTHPPDGSLSALAEALAEEDRLELAPERKKWWQRRLTLHGLERG